MKRSAFKRKPPATPAQKQWRNERSEWRAKFGTKGRSSTGASGSRYKGEWIPSQWQLECLKLLEHREVNGEIEDLQSQITIEYTIYNEAGQSMTETIEIDFVFFDKTLNRHCRWDAKPPKVVHTKHGRLYPQNKHRDWLTRFKQLKFCQPDYDYRIIEKNRTWRDFDFNLIDSRL